MKNLKNAALILFLFIGLQSFAQSVVDGKFNSTFGALTLTSEYDKEFPNGTLVYGDYRDNGTITGYFADFQKEIQGTFYNGSVEGKFIFLLPFALGANQPVKEMKGFWGYNANNKNSTNSGDQWNVTSKTGTSIDVKNVTNVWSGTWNTTDGNMHLVQVGKNITGRYKGLGTVTATYNPSTRLLKGTFLNQNTNKTGYLEFYFEGNTFKGKWGWTAAMTSGNWDGTKYLKTNKELSKMVVTSTTNPPVAAASTNNSATTKYVVSAVAIDASEGNVYGFFGCKLFKVTSSGRQLIQNFGAKLSDFYNTTENNENKLLSKKQNFPNTPEYFREFILNNSDLTNNEVKFELEIYSHMKSKTLGKNINYGFKKEILRLDQINLGVNIPIDSEANGTTIFGSGSCRLFFRVTKN